MRRTAKQLAALYVELTQDKKGKELEKTARSYVDWLSRERQLHRVRDIARAVDVIWKERFGAANVHVESAHPLSSPLRKAIEKLVEGATVTEKVNPDLIGGLRLRIDDRFLDGSVAGQLEKMKRELL